MKIQLEPAYLQTMQKIISQHVDTTIWRPVIFGSRATGTAQPFSDVDLGFIGSRPLPAGIKAKLWDAFDESDIPYVVEIVDLGSAQPDFLKVASRKMVEI